MKLFYLVVLTLVSIAIYLLIMPISNTRSNIISQKSNYPTYVFEGIIDADTIEMFKPSLLFDHDVLSHKNGAYYTKFERKTIKDITKTVESFLTYDETFLAIDKCTYDFDGNLIGQNITKYDNPIKELAINYKTENLSYGI